MVTKVSMVNKFQWQLGSNGNKGLNGNYIPMATKVLTATRFKWQKKVQWQLTKFQWQQKDPKVQNVILTVLASYVIWAC